MIILSNFICDNTQVWERVVAMKEEELVKRIREIKQETGAVGLVDPEKFGPRKFLLRKS